MSISLNDPLCDLVNYCVESIEESLGNTTKRMHPTWTKETFLYQTEHLFSCIQTISNAEIKDMVASAYLCACLGQYRLAAAKLNMAGVLNMERDS
jgi:hypothetical protein